MPKRNAPLKTASNAELQLEALERAIADGEKAIRAVQKTLRELIEKQTGRKIEQAKLLGQIVAAS